MRFDLLENILVSIDIYFDNTQYGQHFLQYLISFNLLKTFEMSI